MVPSERQEITQTVVILAGGRGTRLRHGAPLTPKPLVEVGGQPIIWHVIRIYAAQGARRFLLCLGHRGRQIAEFVGDAAWPDGVEVACLDTGEETPTGGRLLRAAREIGREPFLATYADGVADIDLGALLAQHRRVGSLATVTVVRPQLSFGITRLEGDRVASFVEKPTSRDWVNGGFFCLEPDVVRYLDQSSVLEREPLARLASDGQLGAFRHDGFWACMDTYKDALALDELWASGEAPWKLWDR